MRLEEHNLHGQGDEVCEVYDMPSDPSSPWWEAVTDVPCPVEGCGQTVVWYEAGYVPGHRVCMAPFPPPETILDSRLTQLWDWVGPGIDPLPSEVRSRTTELLAERNNCPEEQVEAVSAELIELLGPHMHQSYDLATIRHRFFAGAPLGCGSVLIRDRESELVFAQEA